MATGWPMKTTYANGDVYSASDVNDTNGTINLLGASVAYAAGKNKIINGDFGVNQRAFSSTTSAGVYTFDRWITDFSGGTVTYSSQAFTPGAAPVSPYESANFYRVITSGQSAAGHYAVFNQLIENVRNFAGQTVTVSFWAKAATGTPKIAATIGQNFGSGGSPSASVTTSASANNTISTSWARYSYSVTMPSLTGKTVGTTANTSSLSLALWVSAGSTYNALTGSIGVQNNTFDIWGVQVEAGSTATAFQTATGTIQGELAACQRYYYRAVGGNTYSLYAFGLARGTTIVDFIFSVPITMRVTSQTIEYSGIALQLPGQSTIAISALANTDQMTPTGGGIYATATGLTTNKSYFLGNNNNAAGYIGLSAEL
jgi:hypothetical protein